MISHERVIKGRPVTQPTAVGTPAGATVGVPMVVAGRLRRVYAKMTGTGANFTLTIYDKETSPGDDNIVFQYDTTGDTDPKLLDENVEIVFKNEAINENRLWVKVVPNAAADNAFSLKLEALAGET